MSQYAELKAQLDGFDIGYPDLFVKVGSWWPHTFEVMERKYPNHLIAASTDLEAIKAAAILYKLPAPSAPSTDKKGPTT